MSEALDRLAQKMKEAQASGAAPPAPVETIKVETPEEVKAKFESTTTTKVETASTQQVPVISNEILLQLLKEVQELREARARGDFGAADRIAKAKPPIDWSKVSERDITNLDLDIPVIEQEKPSYMEVHLKDKMYVARWIHKMPQRLGVCLSEGYTYIKKEDMDDRFPVPLAFDESGNYSHGDVVALKILKSRYYPALKANYVKTMAIHGKATLAKAVETGKSGVQLNRKGEEIIGGLTPEQINPRVLQTYDPGDTPAKGEREFTREMVQVNI